MQSIHFRNRYFLLLDLIIVSITPFISLMLRVDTAAWSAQYRTGILQFTLIAMAVKIPIFFAFGLYRRYWRYASVDELLSIIGAVGVLTTVMASITFLGQGFDLSPWNSLPRSLPFIDGLLTLVAVGGCRFSIRAFPTMRWSADNSNFSERKRVLVVGAGDAGSMIVREMRYSDRLNFFPVAFVDDDPSKKGVSIHGVRVLGTHQDIPKLVEEWKIQEVIIAMPTAPGNILREIVELCQAVQVPSQTMPGIYEILTGQVAINRLRKVKIEDLLRRDQVEIDTDNIAQMLRGKRVLVTGSGGSIGSELCRQIQHFRPQQLIVLGHGENSLFSLAGQLKKLKKSLNGSRPTDIRVIVADIRDRPRLEAIFQRFHPQIVFHAAAHKHVPLMEENAEDAVTNNILGTRNVIEVSQHNDVERFVLISTDKAINPVNVMGMTKRIAEMIVRDAARSTGKPYVSVRFGNVLGSRGSVVPLFQQQIDEGGPVTVTHPEMKRFFMTIPEAVQLVLQAATLGRSGEVFVLDMGEPMKIVDLAQDMIELSGFKVGRDIEIVFTGLRSGEKMYEELFTSDEKPERTVHEKIFVARNGLIPPSDWLRKRVDELIALAQAGETEKTRDNLKQILSTDQSSLTESNEIKYSL